jgi:hypothetical protein
LLHEYEVACLGNLHERHWLSKFFFQQDAILGGCSLIVSAALSNRAASRAVRSGRFLGAGPAGPIVTVTGAVPLTMSAAVTV